jgi:hypothetical protein
MCPYFAIFFEEPDCREKIAITQSQFLLLVFSGGLLGSPTSASYRIGGRMFGGWTLKEPAAMDDDERLGSA